MEAGRARSPGGMEFTFSYTGLRVRDLDASLRFFRDGLGMRVTEQSTVAETGGIVAYLKSEGSDHPLELNWYPPGSAFDAPYEPGEALDHLYFKTRGVRLEASIAHLERHGGKLRIPPYPMGGGRIAYVDGPDGHTVELYEASPP